MPYLSPNVFVFSFCLLLSLYLGAVPLAAQTFRFQWNTKIPVQIGTDSLRNAWAGGLNAAQYSTLSLNADDTNDLVVFDRTSNSIHTFIAEPTPGGLVWQHAPQYATQFPSVNNWMLLVDYDADGRKDVFTSATFGIRVFRNVSTETELKWQLIADPLLTTSASGQFNLPAQSTDIPAITDLDADGDIDILAGNLVGHRVTWFRNQSVEKTNTVTQLDFRTETQCWGDFEGNEGNCNQFLFGINCTNGGRQGGRVQHTGTTLLALDFTNDLLKDLLIAEVGCRSLAQLPNSGSLLQAQMLSSTPFATSKPVSLLFPAAFYEDVDFDGKKDIIATPNVSFNEGNLADFSRSNWLYKNTGSSTQPVFSFVETDFLQKTMIDIGERTTPAFADYDADGDMDLFVGQAGMPTPNGRLRASLYLYENIGTKTTPSFRLKTDNFVNLTDLEASYFRPAFLDWNHDGATDLVLTYTTTTNTQIKIFLNTAPAGQAYQLTTSNAVTIPFVNLRNDFVPCFYDLDRDGDYDLLLGKNLGELEYYQNTGSDVNPVYARTNASFAGLPLSLFDRSQAPLLVDMNANGKPELICGYRNLAEPPYGGRLIIFSDVTTTTDVLIPETRILYNEIQAVYDTLPLPTYLVPAAADLDNDGLPELILGTSGGGLLMLKNRSPKKDIALKDAILLYPNPTEKLFFLITPQDSEVTFFDVLGKQLSMPIVTQANIEASVRVESWATGVYVARITSVEGTYTKRIVVTR